jgi:hypothetical protein
VSVWEILAAGFSSAFVLSVVLDGIAEIRRAGRVDVDREVVR